MSSEVKRFNPDALGDMRENLAGEYVYATDYDTAAAELREFKNGNTMALLRSGFAKACEERDAALAQLAAIQGGMGVEMEVPGDLAERCREILDWQKSGVLTGDALRRFAAGKRYAGDHNEMQIAEADTAREAYRAVLDYQRITAAMAAEVERKTASRDKLAAILRDLVPGCKWRIMRPRIDAALLEIENGDQ